MTDELSNPGWDDRFTCPACMNDMTGVKASQITECDECGVKLQCHVENQPVAVCCLVNPIDDDVPF